jgi:hypothetical protein
VPEFTLPLGPHDQGWIDLRERLACVARELHFIAISSGSTNGAELLVAARYFAGLAMSIPMCPAQQTLGGPVEASTLLAAQILGHEARTAADSAVVTKIR